MPGISRLADRRKGGAVDRGAAFSWFSLSALADAGI